jgi:hypothetical protein
MERTLTGLMCELVWYFAAELTAPHRRRREVYRRGGRMMQPDWHPADIIAGLKKRGTSLSAFSRQAGERENVRDVR